MKKSCCFTGHRRVPESEYHKLKTILAQQIEEKIKEGYSVFCTGGALGFDTMAALAVLNLRKEYPSIELHLYLPCKDQPDKWSERDKKLYNDIINHSDKVTYISEKHTEFCMNQRNRALVDNSQACIAYCTQTTGGTVYTMNYALDKGHDVINLAHFINRN